VSRSRDREAEFTAFVEAGSTSLLRAALVLLDSREEAEDAVQTVLLRTFRRWEHAKQAPEAYSRVVLVNVCRERWRYRARHPEAPGILACGDQLADVASFAEAVDRRHVLVRVLRQLPSIQREVRLSSATCLTPRSPRPPPPSASPREQ
jgi:DNA-directed RNA polymerase specialized sigma24 family protein